MLAEARTELRDQRFEAALSLLSSVEEIDPAVADLAPLREQVRREEAAAQLRAELERTLADLDEQMTRGDLSAASNLVSAATALSPSDERVTAARQRVERAIAARDAAEARTRDLEQKTADAEALFEQGDLQGALRLLILAASLDPQHPRTVLLSERVADAITKREAAEAAEHLARTVDELLAAAAEHLRAADHQPHDAILAMRKITEALALAPDHAGALALKAAAAKALAAQRQEAFVLAAIRNARSRFAIGKHQAALQLLESLDASAHPAVAEHARGVAERAARDSGTAAGGAGAIGRRDGISLPESAPQAGRQTAANELSAAAPPKTGTAGTRPGDSRS